MKNLPVPGFSAQILKTQKNQNQKENETKYKKQSPTSNPNLILKTTILSPIHSTISYFFCIAFYFIFNFLI